jgi:ligand-binding SRPBCC domain-containing protein
VPHIGLTTRLPARPEIAFAACLDVEAHTRSTGTTEQAIAGVTTGQLGAQDTVTWRARHFGVPWRMTVQITEYERPWRFIDEQITGPFQRWRHEHLFAPDPRDHTATLMRDLVDFDAPAGVAGSVVAALVLRPYLQHLIQRRNTFLVHWLGDQ